MKKLLAILTIVLALGAAVPAGAQSNIQYHTPLNVEFYVTPRGGEDHWRLAAPFEFTVDDHDYTVPQDFWTDFASVPQILWGMISPYDLGVGCIPHDYGYRTKTANKDYWDLVFLGCMEKDGISWFKRQAAYYSVRWFGQSAWDRPPIKALPALKKMGPGEIPPRALQWKTFVEEVTK